MRVTGCRVENAIAPATSAELMKKQSGATTAAARASDAASSGPVPTASFIAAPAAETVAVSDATLKTIRCSGLRLPARSVHCASALTVAMQTLSGAPSAKSAQKLTACDSERFEWL